MRRNNKQLTTTFILCSLLLIGVIYAILQANLQINGTAKIQANTWDIHFDNIVVNENSVSIGNDDSAVSIDPNNNCKVDFEVTLSLPGDFYEFTVDAVNEGSIDGMISSFDTKLNGNPINISNPLPPYLKVFITYTGTKDQITTNQLLRAGESINYKIRIEFDSDIEENDLPTTSDSLSLSFSVTYIQADDSGIEICKNPPVRPQLTDGLIPVTIDTFGNVTAVSKDDNNWYDYCNKMWANAVLVTSNKRDSYQRIADGLSESTEILQNEILAYYVWIPRYSYKIWTLNNTGNSLTGAEQEINIKFIKTDEKDAGIMVDEFLTNKSFTFNNKELPGYWVGKFEMSHTTLLSSGTTNNLGCSTISCNSADGLRILPGVSSVRNNNLSNMWYASKSMQRTQNSFGLSLYPDSHLMKNSEWGAVAYLSHSKYGINREVRINNFYDNGTTMTGCGANTDNAALTTWCDITYGCCESYPQSTTGNISGIFDMSGGSLELVMGVAIINNNPSLSASGFSTLPDRMYYDTYNHVENINPFYAIEESGGDALMETLGWYSDKIYMLSQETPWYRRGGNVNGKEASGIFAIGLKNGAGGPTDSWRSVLIA